MHALMGGRERGGGREKGGEKEEGRGRDREREGVREGGREHWREGIARTTGKDGKKELCLQPVIDISVFKDNCSQLQYLKHSISHSRSVESLSCVLFDEKEVFKGLHMIDTNKSCGADGIHS